MSIATEAEEIINGPRQESYGPVEESFLRIASIWQGILGVPIKPEQVVLCMIGLKTYREAIKADRNNRVDIIGYDLLLDRLIEYYDNK